MPAPLPRLEDLPDLRGARVLVRAELNAPLEQGRVSDDLRITTTIPTIEWLRERGAAVALAAHLGRPKGEVRAEFSLAPVAERLGTLLGTEVPLAPSATGAATAALVASLGEGEVLMLENLRFDAGEEGNDADFAKQLAKLGDVFIQEAFGALHRAHASTAGLPKLLPGSIVARQLKAVLTNSSCPEALRTTSWAFTSPVTKQAAGT